jgi:hypothetical protein
METSYPTGNTQAMTLALRGEIPEKALRVRFGPFSPDCETVTVTLNHTPYTLRTEPCGDAKWAWLEIDPNTLP